MSPLQGLKYSTLADTEQNMCARLYTYHGCPDASKAKLATSTLQENLPRQKKKKATSGVLIAEKYLKYNVHDSKFHDVHLLEYEEARLAIQGSLVLENDRCLPFKD
ncbi:hypothetical protein AVEN_244052-1 [Araneus ventricosus]|uniref:Uncharacterized protein n=1 Tax=Araneus ventricosus TaxID=182803 RepID=A0A4Y2IIU6_ARAVE|nr:hypothetical protein AVEN_244052-1 [Araneus ventricosus]